jgi:hypothetical protein
LREGLKCERLRAVATAGELANKLAEKGVRHLATDAMGIAGSPVMTTHRTTLL